LPSRREEKTAESAENAENAVVSAAFASSAVFSSFRWLVVKEYRELMASRAWWVLLLAMGPLVGVTFISAVRTYGEASGLNGTTAGVGEAFSPLVGIWAPTFSACEVAAVFPVAVCRDPIGFRRPPERRAEDRDAASDAGVCAHRGQGDRASRRVAGCVSGAARGGAALERATAAASIRPS